MQSIAKEIYISNLLNYQLLINEQFKHLKGTFKALTSHTKNTT